MAEKKVTRKLAAILATDMVGFSRLMEKDEAGTVARQKAHRKQLIGPKIAEHNGRIVKSTGDGLLVEFASAVDAVQCAVDVQRSMPELEADVPQDRRIVYRVGVNLGDVMVEDDDILGDGVNIASRLQALAEPGGICVSRTVFNHVRNKVELGFVDLGPKKVKNIEEPVQTYKVLLDPTEAGTLLPAKRAGPRRLRWAASAAAVLLLLLGAGALWWQPWVTRVEPASLARMAFPLPKKPSIAVLPFDNLSGDPKQEYLADGITEDIISALSIVPGLFVIARNSTFTYKGKPVKVQRVAEELGVRYLLEGSVQRSGERIRVTAQLIDAISGHHLWSRRYDRPMKDLFALQDEITLKIADSLEIQLKWGEGRSRLLYGSKNLEAWLQMQRATAAFNRFTKENNATARKFAERAVSIDPGYARAWSQLSWTHVLDARNRWSAAPRESFKKARAAAAKSMALDERLASPYSILAFLDMLDRHYDRALAHNEKAVALEPNNGPAKAFYAVTLGYAGRPNEAIAQIEQAMRLSPYHPAFYQLWLGRAYRLVGRNEEAIAQLRRAKKRIPGNWVASTELATVYYETGRRSEAEAEVAHILKIMPRATVSGLAKLLLYKDKKERQRVLAALRKAGLPEGAPLLPKKPSIAVLPFTNMSGDKDQEYFADGMTDDLITALSKVSGIIVVSRTTAFTFKGRKDVKMKDIARTLGVRYVLEGSVRRAGGRVRINAQLIDGTTGGHVWAETFDRDYKQIFALQDDVKGKIIEALEVKLTPKERKRLKRKPTKNLDAYALYLKAEKLRLTYLSKNYRAALALYDEALALDPDFVDAQASNAEAALRAWRLGWLGAIDPPEAKLRAQASLTKALALDPSNPRALAVQTAMQLYLQKHDLALALARGAVARHPRDATLRSLLARVLLASNHLEAARAALKRSEELAPKPSPELLMSLAWDYLLLGEARDAIRLQLRARKAGANAYATAFTLANAYARLGNMTKAKAELETLRRFWPWMSVAQFPAAYAHYRNKQQRRKLIDAYLKAGMPKWPYGFTGRPEHRLQQADLKALYRRGPFREVGTGPFNVQFERASDGKGTFTWKGHSVTRRFDRAGTSEIEGDMLCMRIDAHTMGRKYCAEVYRNPTGSPRTNDEYMRVNYWGLWKFSVKPLKKK